MKRYIITIIVAALASAAGVSAQSVSGGGSAMSFSVFPRDVRFLSMGGVDILDNVAAAPLSKEKIDAQASYTMFALSSACASADINASAGVKLGSRLAVKAFFSNDKASDSYSVIDDTGVASRASYTPSDMFVGGGAAFAIIPEKLSLGADVRYMKSSLTKKVSYTATSFDIVAAYKTGALTAAAGVNSLGSAEIAGSSEYELPTSVMLGAEYAGNFGSSTFVGAAQVNCFFKGGLRAGVGAEYGFKDMLFARVGYNFGGKTAIPSFLSLGIGAKFFGVSLNAAYLISDMGAGNTISAGLGFSF